MQLEDIYRRLEQARPPIVYLSGKTCTGKTTLARRLEAGLGYEVISLDDIVISSVIKPLSLPDRAAVFAEVYRGEDKREWIDRFIAGVREVMDAPTSPTHPLILDGALANVNTLASIFTGTPGFVFIYLHPQNLDTYIRNLTSRFRLASKASSSGLPGRFWALVDRKEFEMFCETHIMTPALENSIRQYAVSSQAESSQRMGRFQASFKDIILVYI